MRYCSYDYTNDEEVSIIDCFQGIQQLHQNGNVSGKENPPPEQVELDVVNEEIDQGFRIINIKSLPSMILSADQGDDKVDRAGDLAAEIKTVTPKKASARRNICTKKSYGVVSLLLSAALLVILAAMILRAQRTDLTWTLPSAEDNNRNRQSFGTSDFKSSQGLIEGKNCRSNGECSSGICQGVSPPYRCQPKKESCSLCSQDANCLSGKCVRRSGKSICASTEDGMMGVGCFCDNDTDCVSQRCEGEPLMYTCQDRNIVCSSDFDCAYGTCNSGQCGEIEMGSVGHKQGVGDSCSGHRDCSSHICVGFAPEKDGKCSEGKVSRPTSPNR